MKNLRKTRTLHAVVFAFLGMLAATGVSRAQLAPDATASGTLAESGAAATPPPPVVASTNKGSAKPADDDIVELNPFVVSSSKDKGYETRDSLGGTRVKTDLRDIAAPTSAFTQQFFDDLAVNSVDSLAPFMLSTEYENNEDTGNANQNNSTGISRALRIRGLSMSQTVDYFNLSYPTDRFSYERIDQARGPNAILFGLGSPGGIINTTTKRAVLGKSQGYVRVQASSYDGLRGEFDYNQPIIANTLAVRVAAMQSRQETWRNYEFNKQKRIFGTLRWKIDNNTELNITGERGTIDKLTARNIIGYDAYTPWVDAGRPLSSVATPFIKAYANNWIVLNTSDGTASNMNKMTYSRTAVAPSTITGLPVTNGILGEDLPINRPGHEIVPMETNFYGPGFGNNYHYSRTMFNLTHSFTRDWFVELSGVRLDTQNTVSDPQTVTSRALTVDTSPNLQNGQPNPNAGRPFLEYLPQVNNVVNRGDALRVMMSYKKDLAWAGRHNLAAYFEYDKDSRNQMMLREQIYSANAPNTTALANTDGVAHNQNRMWRRTYVDLNAPSKDIVMAGFSLPAQNGQWITDPTTGVSYPTNITGPTDPNTGYTYLTAWIPFNNSTQINSDHAASTTGMLQSYFWRDRIVTTLGASYNTRVDYLSDQPANYIRNTHDYTNATPYELYMLSKRIPIPGFTDGIAYNAIPSSTGQPINAKSFTGGIVFHATDWLTFFYDKAANGALPNATGRVWSSDGWTQGLRPPIARGRSDDAGVKLDLFNHRVFATFTWFNTSYVDDFTFSNGDLKSAVNQIWASLDALATATPAQIPLIPGGEALPNNPNNPILATLNPDIKPPLDYPYPASFGSYNTTLRDNTTAMSNSGATKGIEIEITANPTDNLRIYFNYSYAKTRQYDVGPEYLAYLNHWLPFFENYVCADGTLLASKANTAAADAQQTATIGDQANLVKALMAQTFVNNREPVGQMRHKASLLVNYDFTTGVLRGISVGATVRYQSQPVTGYWVIVDTSTLDPQTQMYKVLQVNELWGQSQIFFDLRASYRRKIALFGKSFMWSVQLNINNLFNNDAMWPQRVTNDGQWSMYNFNPPRTLSLTSMIKF